MAETFLTRYLVASKQPCINMLYLSQKASRTSTLLASHLARRIYTPSLIHMRRMSKLTPPPDSWDSHMHVIDANRFPLSPEAVYEPHFAPVSQAIENSRKLNLPNLVFVQPSPFGTDNSCQLDGLAQLGFDHARASVVIDPDSTSQETLEEWHKLGVRGVRVNLKSVGAKLSEEELVETLRKHAKLVEPLKTWAIQLYVDLAVIPQLRPLVEDGVKIVVDHMGSPPELRSDMKGLEGWSDLLDLMRNDNFFVKISAPYRFTSDPEFQDLEGVVKQLLSVNSGNNVVFASDWPHTRFEDANIEPWVQRCLEWCGKDDDLKIKLFRSNAERLWDVKR